MAGVVCALTNARDQAAVRKQAKAIIASVRDTMEGDVKDAAVELFEVSVRKFKQKPSFKVEVTSKLKQYSGIIALFVGPDVQGPLARWPERPTPEWIYKLVDEGTEPHPIRARLAPRLRFQTGYKPITMPGSGPIIARSGGPGKATGPEVTALSVNHPGFPGRDFSKTVASGLEPIFYRRIKEEINKAITRERRR